MDNTITVAITGASGTIYGVRLIQHLLEHGVKVAVVVSKDSKDVFEAELGINWPPEPAEQESMLANLIGCHSEPNSLTVYGNNDWRSPLASGSAAPKRMVICPCSMGTLSAVACGASDNLIERAADVVLKERGQLIVVPRETPLSSIHLQNMLTLSQTGATILPPSPGFYQNPTSISDLVNFIVARIMDQLGIDNSIGTRWSDQPVI